VKIIIRSVSPKDFSHIYQVHHASINALQNGPYNKNMIDAWATSISCITLREEMNRSVMIGFVAEWAANIIGFAALRHQTVCAMYVHPHYQRRGIGSKLLQRLEAEAARKGIHRLKLNSSLNAGSFYEGRGYRVISESPFVFNKTVRLTSLEMVKDII
jgi:putative acetyltransferase